VISAGSLSFVHPGAVTGFDDVSFVVGTTAALIGDNGVGKTILLRILAGELAPDEGTVAVSGAVRYMPQEVGSPIGSRPSGSSSVASRRHRWTTGPCVSPTPRCGCPMATRRLEILLLELAGVNLLLLDEPTDSSRPDHLVDPHLDRHVRT
jgi:ATPase subunit of ABC transporter with duplicated ATPase domains